MCTVVIFAYFPRRKFFQRFTCVTALKGDILPYF